MKLLENKKILVTGVLNEHSIAYGIAKNAQQHGCQLALTYQTSDKLKEKVGKIAKEDFGDCLILPLDVTDEKQCEELFANLAERFGKLDGLVHSIAFTPRETLQGKFHEVTSRQGFATALEISAYSLTLMAKHAAPILAPDASILTLTYLGAERAVPNYNVMGVAKAALESSVRYLASSLGQSGVRVNAISAGPIKTLAARGIKDLGVMLEHVRENSALGRNVTQDEVGKAASFLLSDMASGITGEVMYVDAGYNVMGGMVDRQPGP